MNLEIKLNIDGKEKAFKAKYISARMLKESNKIARRHLYLEPKDDEEVPTFEDKIDAFAEYIVFIYGDQFTIDDVLDGMDNIKFQETVRDTVLEIMGLSEESSEK